jgi:hypothetical protein
MFEKPAVEEVVEDCHWYVKPVPTGGVDRERFTVPLGAPTVDEEVSVFPGDGVPEQGGTTHEPL